MRRLSKLCVGLAVALFCFGCGHTKVCQIGLLSVGDLENRTIPVSVEGPVLSGTVKCKMMEPPNYYLSDAVRNALSGSECDTLVDVEVTTKTGLFVPSNSIAVKGTGLKSSNLPREGVAK